MKSVARPSPLYRRGFFDTIGNTTAYSVLPAYWRGLNGLTVMPIHWGAFVLASHGWDDSPERFTLACEEKGIEVITPRLCETMALSESENCHDRWWREYN